MENKNITVRQTAFKLTVGEILNSEYVQDTEQGLNYLHHLNLDIFRFNVIGIIINIEKQGNITNLWLEDGTGKIVARLFEESKLTSSLGVGTVLSIVGKARTYNQERYISPEILKKVDPCWLKLRKVELGERFVSVSPTIKVEEEISSLKVYSENPKNKPLTVTKEEYDVAKEKTEELEIMEEEIVEEKKELLPTQKLLLLIKEKDQGEGVRIEEIISCSPLNDTEKIIEKMLEKGDIFQNLPGRVRVL